MVVVLSVVDEVVVVVVLRVDVVSVGANVGLIVGDVLGSGVGDREGNGFVGDRLGSMVGLGVGASVVVVVVVVSVVVVVVVEVVVVTIMSAPHARISRSTIRAAFAVAVLSATGSTPADWNSSASPQHSKSSSVNRSRWAWHSYTAQFRDGSVTRLGSSTAG